MEWEEAEIYIEDKRGRRCTYRGLRAWIAKTQFPQYTIPQVPRLP